MAVRFSKFKLRKKDKWDLEGVDDLEHNLSVLERDLRKRIVVDGLYEGSKITYHRVKHLVPKGDGALERSIEHKKLKSSVRIRAGSKEAYYVGWVEYGTDPHRITARRRKALTIGTGFYRAASHPGARPKPFLRRSLDETKDRVVETARDSIRRDIAALPFR